MATRSSERCQASLIAACKTRNMISGPHQSWVIAGLICNVFQSKICIKYWRFSFSFQLLAIISDLCSAACSSAGALRFCWDGNRFSLQEFRNDSCHLSRLSPCFPTVPTLAVALSALVKLVPLVENRSLNLQW